MLSEPSSVDPDLLSVVDALIRSDPNPPGIVGRLAIGAETQGELEWLMLSFAGELLYTSRSKERHAPQAFDCIAMVTADRRAVVTGGGFGATAGDRSLLAKVVARYFQTRGQLAFLTERIQASRYLPGRRSRRTR